MPLAWTDKGTTQKNNNSNNNNNNNTSINTQQTSDV